MAGQICVAGKESEGMTQRKQSGGVAGSRSKPAKKAKTPKRKRSTDPTRDAPFDVTGDGDFVSLRNDLSEDEIKEQADRSKAK
jgi:hypothetical protein